MPPSTKTLPTTTAKIPRVYKAPPSDLQTALPGVEPAATEELQDWPDFSAYKLHFGIVRLHNGQQVLAMVDEESAWGSFAEQWGFKRSRWVGLWIKPDNKLVIPRDHLRSYFPDFQPQRLTLTQIRNHIKTLNLPRQSQRLSTPDDLPGIRRHSWHPTRLSTVPGPHQTPAAQPLNISAEVALKQTLYLGFNHQGQEIYEGGDGIRYALVDGVRAATEDIGKASPLFLRQDKENAAESLLHCAGGVTHEILAGHRLRSEDFERYLKAVFGDAQAQTAADIQAFHTALDTSLFNVLATVPAMDSRAAYQTAVMLHECRPSYWREPGTLPTPLPLAVAMQTVARAQFIGMPETVVDINSSPRHDHSWAWPVDTVRKKNPSSPMEYHDITVAGVFSSAIPERVADGLRVTRADHNILLESLSARNPDGVSVFLIAGGSRVGRLDPDFRRVLSHIGARYTLSGMVDIDPRMISAANSVPSRLLVVGPKRKEIDYTFALPLEIHVSYDYDSLWTWVESTSNLSALQSTVHSSDDREDNRWQAPYIPSSQVSEPQAMSPRNLLGPVRKALARVTTETGMSVDDYVSSKLQWTLDELGAYVDAEQVDAVALGLHAMDKKRGYVEADQTGLGKGRVLSCLMRYAHLQKMPILFLTEKADLFRDIYRDLENIHSAHLFENPFILNSALILRNEAGQIIGRSPSKNDLIDALVTGKPPKASITLATYSQFNRQPGEASLSKHNACKTCLELMAAGASRQEVLKEWDLHMYENGQPLSLSDPMLAAAGDDNGAAIAILINALNTHQKLSNHENLVRQLELRQLTDAEITAQFNEGLIKDAQALKLHWIRANPYQNGLVVMDESHVAAGPTSQTNANLENLVNNCQTIGYSSATFAKDTANFSIYRRIFPKSVNPATIADTLNRGGAPLQEIISAMLAEDGRMIRREHDLSTVEFQTSTADKYLERNTAWSNSISEVLASVSVLSGDVEEIADNHNAQVMQVLRAAHEAQEKARQQAHTGKGNGPRRTAMSKPQTGIQYTHFASRFYSFMRTLSMVMLAEHVSELAIKCLEEGMKPFIPVENTMEAAVRDLLDPDAYTPEGESRVFDGDGVLIDPAAQDLLGATGQLGDAGPQPGSGRIRLGKFAGFKEVLHKYLDNVFYAYEWRIKQKPDGTTERTRRRIELKIPGMEESIRDIRRMITALPDIPLSAIDEVKHRIEAAGYSVGELSGRTKTLELEPDGTHAIVPRSTPSKIALVDAFNNGTLDALIASAAGATGISLHAGETFADQRRRVLIEYQPFSSSAKRMQVWGRIHRKGQVATPKIVFPTTGLPGELRLLMQLNAGLSKMSANTTGNADNSALNKRAPQIRNRIGSEVCYRWMENRPDVAKLMGIKLSEMTQDGILKADGSVMFSGTKFVDLLTNRIPIRYVADQIQTYAELDVEFRALVEQYELEGRNPLKSGELDIRATRGESCVLELPADGEPSTFNEPVRAVELNYKVHLEGIPIAKLTSECEDSRTALEHQFGSPNWQRALAKLINAKAAELMPHMLSKRHATIEAAMADPLPNAVKNLAQRIEFVKNTLPSLVPGSVFDLNYSDEYKGESYLIVALNIPGDALTSLSEYELKVRSANNRTLRTITLSSIMRAGPAFKPYLRYGEKQYSKHIADVFKELAQGYECDASRVILEGNLFRAAQIATNRKMGQAVTYTDEKGVWRHAIALPSNMSLGYAQSLPIDIIDSKMMLAILSSGSYVSISNGFNMDERAWSIHNDDKRPGCFVTAYKGAPAWLTTNKVIRDTLSGEWKGAREVREAVVSGSNLEEFCEAFMSLASSDGTQVLIGSRHREWALKYAEDLRVASNQATIFDAATDLGPDEFTDIDSHLSALTC